MKCPSCGAEIPEGFSYCPSCGEDAVSPVQIGEEHLSLARELERRQREQELEELKQEAQKKREELIAKSKDVKDKSVEAFQKGRRAWLKMPPFYENRIILKLVELFMLLSSVMMIVSPFLRWISYQKKDMDGMEAFGESILDIGKQGNLVGYYFVFFFAFTGVLMLYNFARLYRPEMKLLYMDFYDKYDMIFRILPIVLGILFIVIFVRVPVYRQVYAQYRETYQSFATVLKSHEKMYGSKDGMMAFLSRGWGYALAIISLVTYGITQVLQFVAATMLESEKK